MSCDRCGLLWDVNDPEPPDCLTDRGIELLARGNQAIKRIRENFKHESN